MEKVELSKAGGRDYKKEAKRNKELYTRFYLSLTKEYGEKLQKILDENNMTYTCFIKSYIDSYESSKKTCNCKNKSVK